jgi:hypothetical protein
MLRFLGLMILLLSAFALGYMWGKRPLANLEQTVRDLSRNVMDTTLGIERDLRRREGLVDAKARLVQAKSDLFNKDGAGAVKELAAAADSLDVAVNEAKKDDPHARTKELVGKLRDLKAQVAQGKKGTTARLSEIQRELDTLLNR